MGLTSKWTSGALRLMGRELLSLQAYDELLRRSDQLNGCRRQLREYELIRQLSPEVATEALRLMPLSRAQLRQDIFALSELQFKKDGYFVEFGATNGVDLSNTWLMENHFNWTGILAEPARIWHEALRRNRTCAIDERCVWSVTGESLRFAEVPSSPEFSTLQSFAENDMHKTLRSGHDDYEVATISLNDLLREHGAPHAIDFLSIDTEGSEFEILSTLDFDTYQMGVIVVEHNFSANRDRIKGLLEAHGYVRKWETISHVDDWYVRH